MDTTKLMRPLFYGGNFNAKGRRMQAVFVREVSNGTDSYRLWRRAGKPDLNYPRAENDAYTLYVEIGEYLAPLQMTEYSLIDHCGYLAATEELYGGKDKRGEYFNQLRNNDPNWEQATSVAIALENERIQQLGSDPARQVDYIKSIMDQHVSTYDRYFKKALADTGAAPQVFSAKSIRTLGNLYLGHGDEFEKLRKHCSSRIEYPAAKILDMCFFEYGFQRDTSSQEDND